MVSVFLSPSAHALNLSDEMNSYYQSVFNNPEIKSNSYVTTFGFGNQLNSLNANGSDSLVTTNRNYINLGLNVNNVLNLKASIQIKDPQKSREARVDSEVKTYSADFNINSNYRASFLYTKNKGYLIEQDENSKMISTQKIFLLPNLKFEQASANLFYFFNPNHQSSFTDTLFTQLREDSSSWILMGGYMHSNISGISDFKQFNYTSGVELTDAQIDSMQARIAYSRNWYWTNYYIGTAFAMGANVNILSETTTNAEKIHEVKSHSNTALGFSAGYIGKSFAWGVYNQLFQTSYTFKNLDLSSNIGRVGLNLSYLF